MLVSHDRDFLEGCVDHILALQKTGAVVQSGGTGPFTAALRLPLRPALPLRSAPPPEDLLTDRYSVLQIFLPGFCAGPNE